VIHNLNEVNRLLIAVKKLCDENQSAYEGSVIDFCRNMVIEGQFPNHKETIEFAISIGIVGRVRKNRLKLTHLGKELAALNPTLGYELSEQQKEFITKNCFLEGSFSPGVGSILKQFTPAYSSGTYQWSPIDNTPLNVEQETVDLLRQTGLIKDRNGVLEVDYKYVPKVREIIKPKNIVTPEQLIEALRRANEIGAIAEKIAFDFEKQRLEKLGCLVEAQCIQKISELNIAAGYDIASFNDQTPNLVPNRFIEVKGSTDENMSFYLSSNEIKKAMALSLAYWIYFVPSIDRQKVTSKSEPILIQNPAKNILQNGKFEAECAQFYIRSIDSNKN
jgi:hypothetical protein